jgi:hypothetical protein
MWQPLVSNVARSVEAVKPCDTPSMPKRLSKKLRRREIADPNLSAFRVIEHLTRAEPKPSKVVRLACQERRSRGAREKGRDEIGASAHGKNCARRTAPHCEQRRSGTLA